MKLIADEFTPIRLRAEVDRSGVDGVRRIAKALTVVMPAYNEAKHIHANLLATVAALARTDIDYEIIVVDDGSVDGTYVEALKARRDHPERIQVVRNRVNGGKGSAIVWGAALASGAHVAFLDSDLDLHPSHISSLFRTLQEGKADIVIGSKFHPMSKVKHYPLLRKIYSRAYYAITQILFALPVRDTQTGVKIFSTAALEKIFPLVTVRRFAFDLEILALAHMLGFVIVEAPVRLDFQRAAGRIVLSDVAAVIVDTLRIYFRLRSVDLVAQNVNAVRATGAYPGPRKGGLPRRPTLSGS